VDEIAIREVSNESRAVIPSSLPRLTCFVSSCSEMTVGNVKVVYGNLGGFTAGCDEPVISILSGNGIHVIRSILVSYRKPRPNERHLWL
jgi:hypothetical protein